MREHPEPEFLPPDDSLREDVRSVGAMVGQLLLEQGGAALFERVEALRRSAIHRRREGSSISELAAQLAGLDASTAAVLVRAFATYFQVVNIAERVHRIRRRRDYQRAGGAPQPESLLDVLVRLKAQGVSADELIGGLGKLWVEPVFTAHPTEAVRRSLLEKEQDIVRSLVDGFDPDRTPQERARDAGRILVALSASWQTAEASRVRPSVQDEHDHVSFYLAHPLYRIVPALYEALSEALAIAYGTVAELPCLLHFASWVGGDMDGNPGVGADTLHACLVSQRAQVLQRYREEVTALARRLSQTDDRVSVTPALRERLTDYLARYPAAAARIRPRHADMPYRCLLYLIGARLRATSRDEAGSYSAHNELQDDLQLIYDSLAAHRGRHAGAQAVTRLILRVRTFGFHLARLDVRQDSRVHDDVLAALLGDPAWAARDAAERAARLRPYAGGERTFAANDNPGAAALQAVFATLRDSRRQYGSGATGLYVISMARSVADVLAVLALARRGALVETLQPPGQGRAAPVALDIAPLFETIDDLQNAPETLQALLEDPVYRRHLAARNDQQWVMVGYSDSGKDGGTLASRWGLQRAQVRLMEVARAAGISLAFFHGRGGSTSRGGARMTPALLSAPRGSVAGVLRVTEQGEVIHRKYGIRALALRNLEQTVGAVLRASLRPGETDPREVCWQAQMDELAAHSRQTYRAFVEREHFVEYFRSATPIDVIEQMTLGSRPASRRSMHGVQDLRAIPWVFAWTQCRAIIPGWYGLGSALEHGMRQFGVEAMTRMAQDWPFFDNALKDVEMVLAKCDLGIAAAFSALSGSLHDGFFPLISAEFARTRSALLQLKGSDTLLQDNPRLAASIRLRNPYIDPMSLLQVDLLRRGVLASAPMARCCRRWSSVSTASRLDCRIPVETTLTHAISAVGWLLHCALGYGASCRRTRSKRRWRCSTARDAARRRAMSQAESSVSGPDLSAGVALAELADGGKLVGHVGDDQVLLVRRGAGVFAIAAHCTHYSGPLVDGLIVGDTVRCPWHHACFDLRTGEALRPPALSPVALWSVELRADRIFVREKRTATQQALRRAAPARTLSRIVIVGGGAAGFAAAEKLRREQFAGQIVMLSHDDAAPVDRPNLSKDYLAGTAPEEWMPLRPDSYYADNGIELRLGAEVTGIDVQARAVLLRDGGRADYDRLLLATGAEPVRLAVPGADQPHVRTLRTLSDCRAIIELAKPPRRAVVIGASFIGLEVAASLRTRGIEVHVVAPESRPMERILGAQIGDFVRALHEEHGVVFHLDELVTGIAGKRVTLRSGGTLEADLVVAGIGVRPRVGLAEGAGLAVDHGVVVNTYLETSAPGIYAAGDIARWPDPHSGESIRVEHWVVAQRQGQAAAMNMLGHREAFTAVPYFWSQHYDVPINYVGHAVKWDTIAVEGDVAARDCLVRFNRNGRTLAVASIYRDIESLQAELTMEQRAA